jgi:transposase
MGVATVKPARPVHLEIQKHRASVYGVLRSSYREDGRVKHSNHGRITGLTLEQLQLIQAAFRGEVIPKDSPDAFQILSSKEYGASSALLTLAKELGLPQMLYSRNEPWVNDCMAMIIGRLLYAGSKLSLSHQWKSTVLWELCGVSGPVDVEQHCYEPMDRLLDRQKAIQKALAAKHLREGCLVLYDITSSYLEGAYEESEIVLFGYNRDGKRGHEQICLGLLCNEHGCPVGVEVFAGNTQDASTVLEKVKELQTEYGLKKVIFVGDRGMVTQANVKELARVEGLHLISALTHQQIVTLLERKVITAELFDEKKVVEVIDPENPKRRYGLCRNPESAKREGVTRERLLELTQEGLRKIVQSPRKSSDEKIGARVGRVLQQYKMGKFVVWKVVEGKLDWSLDQAKIDQEKIFDGCYIISSDVPAEQMAQQKVVASYKSLSLVEGAFRNLKTVSLEMRPVYHKKDDRIRSHVFLCMLAYYVQWHAQQRLKPLFAKDGKGKDRQWTLSNVMERLKALRRQRVKVRGVEFEQVAEAEADQREILDLLKSKKA